MCGMAVLSPNSAALVLRGWPAAASSAAPFRSLCYSPASAIPDSVVA